MAGLGQEETSSQTEWTIEQTKDVLLKSAQGKLESEINFPQRIVLNDNWVQVMEGVFHKSEFERGGTVEFMFNHPEENGRIVKTDAKRQKLLVQAANTLGSEDHVATQASISPPEVFVGVIHKHPVVAPYNTEDLLPLIQKDNTQLFGGLVDPEYYYFAFQSKDTPDLSGPPEIARGYMLAVAKNHGERILKHRLGMEAATMTPQMAKELKMPIYKGQRNQKILTKIY